MSIAPELRHSDMSKLKWDYKSKPKTGLFIICDNILDVANLGMICRVSESLGANQVIFTGDCELPSNPKVRKCSVNTSRIINWSYMPTAVDAIKFIGPHVDEVIGLELTEHSRSYNDRRYFGPTAIVLGNEERGIKPETLRECDSFVKIDMHGINYSMNVSVSLAVMGFHLLNNRRTA